MKKTRQKTQEISMRIILFAMLLTPIIFSSHSFASAVDCYKEALKLSADGTDEYISRNSRAINLCRA